MNRGPKWRVHVLTKEIAEQAEMQADKKVSGDFGLAGADNLPSPCLGKGRCKHYIGQVIVNLAINSIRYGKRGRPDARPFRDMLSTRYSSRWEGITIGNQQGGFAPRLERFYCTDKWKYARANRAAAGPAWHRSISSKRTRSTSVRSEPGVGSTFSFTLKKVNLQN